MGGARCPAGFVPTWIERGTLTTGLGRRCFGSMGAALQKVALSKESEHANASLLANGERPPADRRLEAGIQLPPGRRVRPKGSGIDCRKASAPCSLGRTTSVVRSTCPGNRADREGLGRPGAGGTRVGHLTKSEPTPRGPGRPSKGAAQGTPRSPVSRTPSGGSCPEESASDRKGASLEWTMRISFCPCFCPCCPRHHASAEGPSTLNRTPPSDCRGRRHGLRDGDEVLGPRPLAHKCAPSTEGLRGHRGGKSAPPPGQ